MIVFKTEEDLKDGQIKFRWLDWTGKERDWTPPDAFPYLTGYGFKQIVDFDRMYTLCTNSDTKELIIDVIKGTGFIHMDWFTK